ncbi:MAG: hypothetical protein QG620_98 [Patescibacteria group bacterium]|nr:hypothetical protein [Patescibacteria group bacterium]
MWKKISLVVLVAFIALTAVSQVEARKNGTVVLTFDDVRKNVYTNAVPILDELGFKATFFPATSWMNELEYMTEEQIKKLFDEGNEIGCHTRNHISPLELDYDGLVDEIEGARADLEAIGVTMSKSFAAPFGEYNPAVIAQLMVDGVINCNRHAFQGDGLAFNKPKTFNPVEVIVVSVRSYTSLNWLRRLVSKAGDRGWILVLVFHGDDKVPADEYDMRHRNFTRLMYHINWWANEKSGPRIDVLTLAQAIEKYKR